MWIKILLLFFVFSFLFKTDYSFDQDLGRHLKLGEIIWQTKTVPKTNLFSYTNPDFPFINTHWLFEVFAYLASQTIGLQALLILKIIILLLSVYLILKVIPKENSLLLLPIGFIFLHVLRERTDLRPEILSFLFTGGSFYILEKYLRGPTKLISLLPMIQFFWINIHIYFFVGLVIQAIFLVHLGYQHVRFHLENSRLKLLSFVFILSLAISLFNPYGLTTFLYPLNVTKNYGYTIVENQTMFLLEDIKFRDANFLFVKLSIAIAVLSILISFLRRNFAIKDILLAGFGVILAVLNVRSFPYLVFLTLPAALQCFGSIKVKSLGKILVVIFGGLLILESYFYLNGDYYRNKENGSKPNLALIESGKSALDFVVNNNLPSPIYNNFDIGSYIIYRTFPKYRVFVDGRPEAYPKEFFSQVYIPTQADYFKFKELEKQFGFKTIVFSHTDQTPWGKAFLASIVKDETWKTVYIDDFIIVLMRNDILASPGSTLQPIDLYKLDPGIYSFDSYLSYLKLSLFLVQTGNTVSAQKFAEKGLSLFPQSPLGNALFGTAVQNKFFW